MPLKPQLSKSVKNCIVRGVSFSYFPPNSISQAIGILKQEELWWWLNRFRRNRDIVSSSFHASYAALWSLAVLQGLLTLVLLQQLAKLRRLAIIGGAEDHLPIGSKAPEFAN